MWSDTASCISVFSLRYYRGRGCTGFQFAAFKINLDGTNAFTELFLFFLKGCVRFGVCVGWGLFFIYLFLLVAVSNLIFKLAINCFSGLYERFFDI